MRTTLDIANDVLQAAKELARREKKTTGEVISELAQRALTSPGTTRATPEPQGVPLISISRSGLFKDATSLLVIDNMS